MVEKQVLITYNNGLHLRPAGEIVSFANDLKSSIILVNGDRQGNLKSILNVLCVCIREGDTINIQIHGDNCKEESEKLFNFIENIGNIC